MNKIRLYITLGVTVLMFTAVPVFAAWTGPTATPPGNNVSQPLNTSSTGQTKDGGLLINTLGATNALIAPFGNVGFGTWTPSYYFHVRGDSVGFELDNFYMFGRTNYTSGLMSVSDPFGIINIGDVAGDVSNTYLTVSDYAQTVSINATAGTLIEGGNLLVRTGSLGIGTDYPNNPLSITTVGAVEPTNDNDVMAGFYGNGRIVVRDIDSDVEVGFGTTNNDRALLGTVTNHPFLIRVANDSSKSIWIDNVAGNVGIGNTAPSQKLDVNGYVRGSTGLCIGSDCRTSWPTGGAGGVTSITAGTGLSGGTITTTGTISADTSYLQRRIGTACGAGQAVQSVAADGTPTCISTSGGAGTITGVTAGTDMSGGGTSGTVTLNNTSTLQTVATRGATYTGGILLGSGSPTNGLLVQAGNVGIGTLTPAAKLQVVTSGGGNLYVSDYGCGAYGGIGGNSTLTGCTNYALLTQGGDTFINRPSGNALRFRENNGDQMIIATGGNVGIGTVSPANKLDVMGGDISVSRSAGLYGPNVIIDATNSGGRKYVVGSTGSGDLSGAGKFNILDSATGASRLVIDSSGNVGIDITSPTQKLDVNGYVRGSTGLCIGSDCRSAWPGTGGGGTVTSVGVSTSDGSMSVSGSPVTAAGTISLTANTSYLQRRVSGTCSSGNAIQTIASDGTVTCQATGGVEADTLQTVATRGATYTGGILLGSGSPTNGLLVQAGNVGIGTLSPTAILTIDKSDTPQIDLNTSGTGRASILTGTSGNLVFSAGGVGVGNEKVRILSSGNVGIGITNPSEKLQVSGGGARIGDGNLTHTVTHGNYAVTLLPAANNGAGTGEAGLYTWISEPGATWTAGGIARNMRNSSAAFPRVNTGLSGQMIRFGEGNDINFYIENTSGTRWTPLYIDSNTVYMNDARSTIFYDRDNAGYYVDPNSSSRLEQVVPSYLVSPFAGTDSGLIGARHYQFGYQEPGAWSGTFPDLVVGYHTGMKMGGNSSYGGVRFYNDHPSVSSTEIFSVGNTDNNVRVQYDLRVGEAAGTDNICLNGSCISSWPTGGAGGVTSITAGTGLSGGTITTTGTISADTSYLQRRVSGTCSSGNAIQTIASDGTVTCQATGVTGSGSTNYLSKWTGGTSLGNSVVYDDGNNVGIGTTNPGRKLEVNNLMKFTNSSGDANDGVIGTAPFAAGLNIVGINTDGGGRKVNMWGSLIQNENPVGNTLSGNTLINTSGRLYFWSFANPTYIFESSGIHINGDATHNVYIDNTDLRVGGATYASAFYYSSDEKLKKNIKTLSGSLDKIQALRGVSFNWKEGGRKDVGLVAQEVEKVFPEAVITTKDTGLKSVEYGNLVAPLIEAIKEQQKQIDSLKKQVEELSSK